MTERRDLPLRGNGFGGDPQDDGTSNRQELPAGNTFGEPSLDQPHVPIPPHPPPSEQAALPVNARVRLTGIVQGMQQGEREELNGCMLFVSPFLARRRVQITDLYVMVDGGMPVSARCEGELSSFVNPGMHVYLQGLKRGGILTAHVVIDCQTNSLIYQRSRCFIATAACGSPCAEDVGTLVAFRETVLRKRVAGRFLVRLYEALSPPLAAVIARSARLRTVVRSLFVRPAARLAEHFLGHGAP